MVQSVTAFLLMVAMVLALQAGPAGTVRPGEQAGEPGFNRCMDGLEPPPPPPPPPSRP